MYGGGRRGVGGGVYVDILFTYLRVQLEWNLDWVTPLAFIYNFHVYDLVLFI